MEYICHDITKYLLTDPLFGGKGVPWKQTGLRLIDGWMDGELPSLCVPEMSRDWDGREDSRREPREPIIK